MTAGRVLGVPGEVTSCSEWRRECLPLLISLWGIERESFWSIVRVIFIISLWFRMLPLVRLTRLSLLLSLPWMLFLLLIPG